MKLLEEAQEEARAGAKFKVLPHQGFSLVLITDSVLNLSPLCAKWSRIRRAQFVLLS